MALNAADEASDDKCPFCYKAPHEFPAKKKSPNTHVVSKPSQLGCADLPVAGPWNHTTAKHHLISAMQCFAKVRRLVRMASMVAYDINDPPNGIALPTVANNITYTVGGKGPAKYGTFSEPEKTTIAFAVMDQALAQWHVGHHAFTVEIPVDWAEEANESDLGHEVSYDQSVIKELLDILVECTRSPLCMEEDENSTLKEEMDGLSERIKKKLDKFGANAPRQSAPFYVSRMAHDYADKSLKRGAQSLEGGDDGDPAPSQQPSKKRRLVQ